MASVKQHYDSFLGRNYSWMCGDFGKRTNENLEFFRSLEVAASPGERALDLGCGPGFQSIALAALGFEVTAVDLCAVLLEELATRNQGGGIKTVESDLLEFLRDCPHESVSVITCMGDTVTHLGSLDEVSSLLAMSYELLAEGGMLVLSYRDLTAELTGAGRAIPVYSDENRILTTFLEYGPELVTVNDMLYERSGSGWSFCSSSFNKLRVGAEWMTPKSGELGFRLVYEDADKGFVRLALLKQVTG
ncbi:MAG: class I SAM-dependent methyltransferase [Actinobacteria bacterium]|nr:class I SAM-dependent methyltransferase [Actinomycetota bacterium]